MAPPSDVPTRSPARRALRDRVAMVLGSEAFLWALVLGCVSAVAAVSGAVSD